MKKNINLILLSLSGSLWGNAASAAPLDVFLTADNHMRAGAGTVELAYDAVNSTLDVLKIRANDPVYGGTTVGDYSGLHLRGGYSPTDRLWLDGGMWQRKISYRNDVETIKSWQAAAQYRLTGDVNRSSQYAVRLSTWGNYADVLNKTSPTTVQGMTLQSASIGKPSDVQIQADLLATWQLSHQTDWSAFVGAGASRVTVGALSGMVNGCNYNITASPTGATATLSAPCGALLAATVFTPTAMLQELSYNASYYQVGTNLQWHNSDWELRGGYQFQYLNRANVDSSIVSRGGVSYQANHVLVADVSRKITPHIALFARGQMMSNQFVGEIPFVYNGVTASKFSNRYGMASFGVTMKF